MEWKRFGFKGFRNIFALGLVSFFTDISSEMTFSLLPAFLLGLPGGSRATLGLIEGLAEALSYGLRAVSGVFSDKFRRRKLMVLVGYGLSTAVKPLFAAAQTASDVLVIRVTDRIGKAVRTSPRDALLSDSVKEGRRGTAFGLHRALDQSGAIIGPGFATVALLFLGLTVRDVFWISLVPGVIALLILLFLVQERVAPSKKEFRLLQGMRMVLTGRFRLLLVVVGLFSLGAFNFSFILLNAKESGLAEPLIPLAYAVINVAHAGIAIPSGILADRVGREKALVIGYGTFLAAMLLMILLPRGPPSSVLVAVVFGLYVGIVETVQRAMVPGYADSALRGTAYGLYYLVVGTAFFVANLVVGTLWELYGPTIAVAYSAALVLMACVGMLDFIVRGGRLGAPKA